MKSILFFPVPTTTTTALILAVCIALSADAQTKDAQTANAQVAYPFDLPDEITAALNVDNSRTKPVNHLLLGLNCNWPEGLYGKVFALADYFQINASHKLIAYDKASGSHTRTAYGAAYEIIRDVFENAEIYDSSIESTTIGDGLDAVSAEAVVKDGKVTVFAINKITRSVPFHVTFTGTSQARPLVHQTLSFMNLNQTRSFELDEDLLCEVASGDESLKGNFVLPPLSLNRLK